MSGLTEYVPLRMMSRILASGRLMFLQQLLGRDEADQPALVRDRQPVELGVDELVHGLLRR